jgi:nucleosome binding factor SPN SPT16 subunit
LDTFTSLRNARFRQRLIQQTPEAFIHPLAEQHGEHRRHLCCDGRRQRELILQNNCDSSKILFVFCSRGVLISKGWKLMQLFNF